MMTVITTVQLNEGCESEWDEVMADRLASAADRVGFVDGRILFPVDLRSGRVILGTWKTQGDWEAWHTDPDFKDHRSRLDTLQQSDGETIWYDVGAHVASPGLAESLAAAAGGVKKAVSGTIGRFRARRSPGLPNR